MARGNKSALDFFVEDLKAEASEQELDFLDHQGQRQAPTTQGLISWAAEHAPKVFPGWVLDKPTRLMLEEFQRALEGKDQRVLCAPSARQGKTTCLALTLVWSLFRWPVGNPQILISSNQRNASNIAKKCLNLFAACGGTLHPKSKSATEWAPSWRDGLSSQVVILGRSSSSLGYGAATLYLDDVVGSRTDSMNPNFMADTAERMSDWFSRLERRPDQTGSCVINIAQRLSSTDLAAVCMRRFKDRPWTAIHIPVYHTPADEVMTFYPDAWRVRMLKGEVGTPTSTRFDPDWLEERKLALSPAAYNAMLMADVREDSTICSFKPEFLQEVQPSQLAPGSLCLAIDAALTAGGDATGWAICGTGAYEMRGKLLVLDAGEWQADVVDLIPSIIETVKKHRVSTVLVERGGGGLPLLQTLNRYWDNFAVNITGVSTRNQSKQARLEALLGQMAMGNVVVPQDADWLPLVRSQLRSIALGRTNDRDDVGDAVVYGLQQAANWAAGGFTTGTATWGRSSFFENTSSYATWGHGTKAVTSEGSEYSWPCEKPMPTPKWWGTN